MSGSGKSPGAPDWARALVEDGSRLDLRPPLAGTNLRITARERAALVTFEVPAAAAMDDARLREVVDLGYCALARVMRARSLFPLRFWNFVPGIGEAGPSGLCAYEVFNQARCEAFVRPEVAALGEGARVSASAVDPRGGDFSIHVLAGDCVPEPIDNPRQIEPHAYSARYGPVPPRFARGVKVPPTLVEELGFPRALISGTASIVGEETRHPGDLGAQLLETAVNLATVALAAGGPVDPRPVGAPLDDALAEALGGYAHLRVYLPRSEDESTLLDWIDAHFSLEAPPEIVNADLCRTDLLVEVEGTLRPAG